MVFALEASEVDACRGMWSVSTQDQDGPRLSNDVRAECPETPNTAAHLVSSRDPRVYRMYRASGKRERRKGLSLVPRRQPKNKESQWSDGRSYVDDGDGSLDYTGRSQLQVATSLHSWRWTKITSVACTERDSCTSCSSVGRHEARMSRSWEARTS